MFKIWTIAWKEIYIRFTDRNLLLILLAAPLAISTIVGLAFGGLGGGDTPIRDIPIAIVNADQGLGSQGPGGQLPGDQMLASDLNFGQVYISLLVPGQEQSAGTGDLPDCDQTGASAGQPGAGSDVTLFDLTEAVVFDAALAQELASSGQVTAPAGAEEGSQAYVEAAARAAVDQGIYTAAVFIPEGFTQRMTQFGAGTGNETLEVEVYSNGGRPVSAGIVRSIIEGITNQLLTGSITIAVTFSEAAQVGGAGLLEGLSTPNQGTGSFDFESAFACAFTPDTNTIQLETQTVNAQETQNTASIILVSVGSAQAMFFALFTGQFGVFSMYDERREWTLQRLLTTPTPKSYILVGKLIGVFFSVMVQLLLLMIALSLVGSLLESRLTLIWGSNLLAIFLVLVSISLAVSGLGMLLAGVSATPEQGQIFASVLNMGMAVLGGAFGFSLPPQIAAFSLLFWGREAFTHLAAGQTDIGLNVLVLVVQGVVMYLIGLVLFNRRFKV